jgi:serine/threonine protein kinase
MKKGAVINGYTILANATNANAGMSEWTFAEKRVGETRREYFIKRFLRPVYLDDTATAPEAVKQKKRAECERFEAHHRRVISALKAITHEEGNLNVPVEIFRFGNHYYKVTRKVDVSNLTPEQIAALDFRQKLVILKTSANSLKILHDKGIVHGDLKPTNILIKRTEANIYTTKLIDFDNAYFEGEPPENPEELIVDAVYASPEQYLYMKGTATTRHLTTLSDIFTLGLIYHQYLTGEMPAYDTGKYRYPYQAVLNGDTLMISPSIEPPELNAVLSQMLRFQPSERPMITDVVNALMAIRVERMEVKPPALAPPPVTPESSAVTIRPMKKRETGSMPASPTEPVSPPASAPDDDSLPPAPAEPTIRPMRKRGET